MSVDPVSVLIGLAIGGLVGPIAANIYVAWLDDHRPDWFARPFPRCFLP